MADDLAVNSTLMTSLPDVAHSHAAKVQSASFSIASSQVCVGLTAMPQMAIRQAYIRVKQKFTVCMHKQARMSVLYVA